MAAPLKLTRTHRILVGVVIAGAVVIAAIGFAGSYAAVRELALQKGFGSFSYVFPIGIDAGICVLLALDLLLTWIRIPFPLLRQTAWLLTAATIAFNGAAAWPDPLGTGMHAVIPILFVVAVEAARHAIGRIADITADKHMEGVRITRWLLSPLPTFLLWRRMKLWELRSYDEVIKLEQERLVYQARLRSRFGRAWRRKAPVESLMPLRLARYGVPLAQTAPEGLAAAGIEAPLLPAVPAAAPAPREAPAQLTAAQPRPEQPSGNVGYVPPAFNGEPRKEYRGGYDPNFEPPVFVPEPEHQGRYEERYEERPPQAQVPAPRAPEPEPEYQEPQYREPEYVEPQYREPEFQEPEFPVPNGAGGTRPLGDGAPDLVEQPTDDELYQVFRGSIEGEGLPTPKAFAANVEAQYGERLTAEDVQRYMNQFAVRFEQDMMSDYA
ncbi:DUF2637 domain-containing protein [Streptomyces sp. NBC_00006]|uniref:DUF2637 domain-containing protein n=1 Tax=unclassified Streptomyces TaxID=2593676 RepID=UPI00224D6DE5|nr:MULTISPECIES: DUF2637 domain-containing protein [unclassified Streptomyces]MCX5532018.1 DUF2637 domain-containing protein [Streptomyces sp. NBC_00006]